MSTYNPYENMLNTLDAAANQLGLTRNDYEVIRHPERELKVSIPLQLDNGDVKVYEGYRCQHSTIRGSAKGGLRFHPDADENEVESNILNRIWAKKKLDNLAENPKMNKAKKSRKR